jgi:hypothetical protein
MNITTMDDLLTAARAQTRAQRLLFVFAKAELPTESSPSQQAQFLAGQGGALVPVVCVDKTPDELTGMAQLLQESQALGVAWTVVFVTTMSGQPGQAPSSTEAEPVLERLVAQIKEGQLEGLVPFDREGNTVNLQ